MKYCKKCFRNVREEVTGNICPYCGAPDLEEYGSQKSGEDFSCTHPKEIERSIDDEIRSLSPKKSKNEPDPYADEPFNPFGILGEEKDAYGNVKNPQKDCRDTEYDAYGSRAHDEKCDNAPDQPKQAPKQSYKPKPFSASAAAEAGTKIGAGPSLSPSSSSSSSSSLGSSQKTGFEGNIDDKKYTMRIEYLNMLKKIGGISKERIDELMRRYDETHGKAAGSPSPKPYTAAKTYSPQKQGSMDSVSIYFMIVIGIFFGFFQPILGIIILNSMRTKLKNTDAQTAEKAKKIINMFTVIFAVWLVVAMLAVFGSAFGMSMQSGWGGLINV